MSDKRGISCCRTTSKGWGSPLGTCSERVTGASFCHEECHCICAKMASVQVNSLVCGISTTFLALLAKQSILEKTTVILMYSSISVVNTKMKYENCILDAQLNFIHSSFKPTSISNHEHCPKERNQNTQRKMSLKNYYTFLHQTSNFKNQEMYLLT